MKLPRIALSPGIVIAAYTSGLLLAGCASPIKSVPYVAGKPVEGIRYNLSKTTVKVTARARLTDCSPQPVIELLPFVVSSDVSADPAASYVINPRDSVNWFRTVDVPELKLTTDGRMASAKTEAKEQIAPTVLAIAKAVAASANFKPLFATVEAQADLKIPIAAVAPAKAGDKCTDSALELVAARSEVAAKLKDFRRDRLAAVSDVKTYDKDSEARLKTLALAETQLQASYDVLDAKLTKQQSVQFDQDGAVAVSGIDLPWGWVVSGGTGQTIGCHDNVATEGRALEPARPLCLHFDAALASKTGRAQADPAPEGDGSYGGIYYRIPGPAELKIEARAHADAGVAGVTKLRVPKSSSALRPAEGDWIDSANSTKFTLSATQPQQLLQFGVLARMPGDVGLLTTNSISTTFDSAGAPQSTNWRAEPVPIAALLSLPGQIAGLRPTPAAPPPASAELQSKLLLALLQSCIDAVAAGQTPPSYCATLSK